MESDERVRGLLEETLNSGRTPEEVCADYPEHLEEVRRRWLRIQVLAGDLDRVFPSSGGPRETWDGFAEPGALPDIPGYVVESVLGHGGMGVVFKARHVRLGRDVAIKMLRAADHATARELAGLVREAQSIAALRHPHIVQVHDVGEHDGLPYFTMEFVEGGSLAQKLSGQPQAAMKAAQWVSVLARAVHAAHDRGIVHRDLKPGNVLVGADGTLKITDFGLARRTPGPGETAPTIARVGTPSYMPPEQALGTPDAFKPAVDIYSLGAILYEMLTGRPPFRAETPTETQRQVLSDEPVPPSTLNPRVPRDLETICLKCLQKAAPRRYATALELAEDLARFQRGDPVLARPVSRWERAARWARRKPAAATLIVAAALVLGLAIAGGVWRWRLAVAGRAEVAKWAPRFDLAQRLESSGQFQEARAVLQHVPDVDIPELKDRIRSVLAELDLAQKLDQIRLDNAAVVDGHFDLNPRSDQDYEAAFAQAGVRAFAASPIEAAAAIRASPLRAALIAAMDDWATSTDDRSRRTWIFEVARLADPDPSGWRDRVRDPAISRDALLGLADAALVNDQPVKVLVAVGQRLLYAGALPTEFLRRVQRQYPGDFWANFSLGDALWLKKPVEAMRYYQAALAIRPQAAVAHEGVARCLEGAGRIDEAVEHYREAIRLDPGFVNAIAMLGAALSKKGPSDESLELVRRAAALDPNHGKIYQSLAQVLYYRGQFGEAIDALRRGIEINPNDTQMRIHLGFNLLVLGRLDEAVEQFEFARRLEPSSMWPPVLIGSVRKTQGRLDEAMALFEAAEAADPESYRPHFELGGCWLLKNEPHKALTEFCAAVALQADDSPSAQARRTVLAQLGSGDIALAEWQAALKKHPPDHSDWYGFAELCLYLGHQDEYERACHELLAQFESSDDPQLCERVGRACLLGVLPAGDNQRGAALIERALRADPTRSPAWARPYFLLAQGLARYRLGDFDGATTVIQGDVLGAHGPLPYLVLSMAYQRAGRQDQSLRAFATAMRKYDWNPSQANGHDAWLYHVLRREAEPLVMPNLTALLAGSDKPRDQEERLALAAVCGAAQRTRMAAGLYADAFDADPALAERLDTGDRYYAACCAARAGSGDGQDAAGLDDEQRASLREQARLWLRADLARWASSTTDDPPSRARTRRALLDWRNDASLAAVRDSDALARLSETERQECDALWTEVNATLGRLQDPP